MIWCKLLFTVYIQMIIYYFTQKQESYGRYYITAIYLQWHFFVVSAHSEILGVMTLICDFAACVHSHLSYVRLFVTLWTAACQASLSMGFSRQEYWSGLPCPPPGDLPDPGIEPEFPMSPALAGGFSTTSATQEAQNFKTWHSAFLPHACPSEKWYNTLTAVLHRFGGLHFFQDFCSVPIFGQVTAF